MISRLMKQFVAVATLGATLGAAAPGAVTSARAAPSSLKTSVAKSGSVSPPPRSMSPEEVEFNNMMTVFANIMIMAQQKAASAPAFEKMMGDALSGMLGGLDSHSAYLDEQEYAELQGSYTGQFGGVGLEVTQERQDGDDPGTGAVRVVAPIDKTPSARAGLKAGDIISKVDDTSVMDLSLKDVVRMLRGAPDSRVKVTVLRDGAPEPLEFDLVREIIHNPSVTSRLIGKDIAYVRLGIFDEGAAENVEEAFHALEEQADGKLQGLILDLRNDPGGLLKSAADLSSDFLGPNKKIVSMRGRTATRVATSSSDAVDYTGGLPMVVQINGGSASASEIVAGALQDYQRATIMGTQSFGKGSVQTVFSLGRYFPGRKDAIKITTELYYRPSGRSLQGQGVTPNIGYVDPAEKKEGKWFRSEAQLKNTLPNPNGPDMAEDPVKTEKTCMPAYNESSVAGMDPGVLKKDGTPDYEIQCAVEYLRHESRFTKLSDVVPRIPGLTPQLSVP